MRYRNHPAIWGWELGNEYNLCADLPRDEKLLPWVIPKFGTPATRSEKDFLTHDDVTTAVRVFAETVRKFDPLRPITSGHAIARPSSYHLRTEGNWKKDTTEEFAKDLLDKHPDPVNLISTHIYPEAHEGFFGNEYNRFEDLITCTMDIGKDAKKAVFLGEFGALDDEEHGGREEARKENMLLLKAIEDTGIPLSALWVYDFSWQDNTINVTSTNHRSYLLDELKAINERMRKEAHK